MDSNRVREVMEDSLIYEVRFKGAPVWIEELNGVKARIRSLETGRHFEVMVHELVEGEGMPGKEPDRLSQPTMDTDDDNFPQMN